MYPRSRYLIDPLPLPSELKSSSVAYTAQHLQYTQNISCRTSLAYLPLTWRLRTQVGIHRRYDAKDFLCHRKCLRTAGNVISWLSVLWHCWLGVWKSIRPVKKLSGDVLTWLQWGTNDLHMVQLMPLPPIISCFIKIENGLKFLVRSYPGCPRKEAVNLLNRCLSLWKRVATFYC